ncbi:MULTISPECIES: acetolactate synthase AlsS [Staphylococcus]|jgi:acetolactate synthase-1/2/3 large subunit|uniref:Acetolactate synthase AlsS n=1 Tax=Staphylococcus hominis TaxID=1290 RepID=A0A4V2KX75_STAHO|nr:MULTISPECIES: acetolactate synthase AlsS [Staphylococcus]EUZ69277.1 acetolactate synthase, catabolic [Staphylococcus sp. M0480]OFK84685.1 acetolactate synthase [Staphylococcus sp. HMSC057A02]OFN16963.1 acetolactate synthase [Staphylococcus sp. HMSC058D09]OFR08970.1 acetolactate synthase [Staphylococcus sp. HMSC078E07]OFU79107.1 acetolactate synthase [Staphylococcus sp. HMSC10B09]OHO56479.1 acetolactate synthase [Staphylococcus sp. HMSC035F02]SIH55781.1 acetolactate synthase [Mycobacteroid
MAKENYSAADMVIDTLKNNNVDYVFGIPGAKIDYLFDALEDDGPELIVTRHEQNAAMMAQGIGRLTGKPGVALVTSGPGVSNLTTGLLTATSEGDPVLAIGGQVKRNDLLRLTHQAVDNAALLKSSTKYSAEVQDPESLSEVMTNAIRTATSGKNGASFISIPQDVISSQVQSKAIDLPEKPHLGVPTDEEVNEVLQAIKDAKFPVLLAGMRSSSEKETEAIRKFVEKTSLPVVETFQGAGVISRELEDHFFGRVGLFRNQVGDELLRKADLVVAIGYDPIEYEASNWNKELDTEIISIDEVHAEITNYLRPKKELVGNIAGTIQMMSEKVSEPIIDQKHLDDLEELRANIIEATGIKYEHEDGILHPVEIINTMQKTLTDDTTVTVDVGSHYIWMARKFRSYNPRHLLFSNGMQTLGVALPWAIAAALVRPNTQVVSVAGDGGFLFSGQDLETAVRKKLNIIQLIWNDGKYNMVEFQEEMKYKRAAGVAFGPVDYVKYAESFGAKGIRVTSPEELEAAIKEGYETEGPVLIDIPVNYKDNIKLSTNMLPDSLN